MLKRRRLTTVLAVACLLVLLGGLPTLRDSWVSGAQDTVRFDFGVFGDLGYTPREEPLVTNVLTEMNAARLAFAIHLGDLGSPGNGSCTDELWSFRLSQFQALAHPVFYTPGDNDWTDCHAGPPGPNPGWDSEFDPLERLARVRQVFFPDDSSLGQRKIPLTRQSVSTGHTAYRENARWTQGR